MSELPLPVTYLPSIHSRNRSCSASKRPFALSPPASSSYQTQTTIQSISQVFDLTSSLHYPNQLSTHHLPIYNSQSWLAEKQTKSRSTSRARRTISLSSLMMQRRHRAGRPIRPSHWHRLSALSRSLLPTSKYTDLPLTWDPASPEHKAVVQNHYPQRVASDY